MRSAGIRWRGGALIAALRHRYRHSELRKLRRWLKGKTLHPALYLVLTLTLLGAVLGVHRYRSSFFYVVEIQGREIGLVRDAAEIERFLESLTEKCSLLYGMPVEPGQAITLTREYRSRGEEDVAATVEALRQQISLITGAVMLTVDQVAVIPLGSPQKIDEAITLLSDFYIGRTDGNRLLEAKLIEEIAAEPCRVAPEAVYSPEEAVAFLRDASAPGGERLLLAGRQGSALREGYPEREEPACPSVHLRTVEEVRAVEKIPYRTSYRYSDQLWYAQSKVLVAGKAGEKEVVYHVTRENGREVARRTVSERVRRAPVTRVIEKGTARAPSLGGGRFLWPVAGGTVSSGFRTAARPGHNGVDIIHPGGRGTPILAADDGVVVETGSRYPRGNYIVIYHGSYYTLYLHNQANYVSAGASVVRGQTIAAMGSTGNSTGNHLHFEVRRGDSSGGRGCWSGQPALNPMSFFNL